MLSPEMAGLTFTAASLGVIHTLLGPDHYLPFVVMARAKRWSQVWTAWITLLCGLGHIASSVVLGLAGIALGVAVTGLEGIEALRGDLAAWALIAFGLVYFAWGLKKAGRSRPHDHIHIHEDGMCTLIWSSTLQRLSYISANSSRLNEGNAFSASSKIRGNCFLT